MRKDGGFCSRATDRTTRADVTRPGASVMGASVNVFKLRARAESCGASFLLCSVTLMRVHGMRGYKDVKAIDSRVKSVSFGVECPRSGVKPARAGVN